MRFKTKDLMVSLTPEVLDKDAKLCIFRTTICVNPSAFCRFPTNDPCVAHTSLACCVRGTRLTCFNFSDLTVTGCGAFGSCGGPGGSACDTTYVCPGSWWEIEHIEDLVAIKDELRQVITQLEGIEKSGLPSRFETLADANAAEEALSQALEQVRAQKKGLK